MIVSRRIYQDTLRRIEALEADLRRERDRYTSLVARMSEMQRQGFRLPDPAPADVPQPKRLPPLVLAAITEKMDPRGQAARQTAELAMTWLDQGDDPEVVAAKIRWGAEPPTPEDAS